MNEMILEPNYSLICLKDEWLEFTITALKMTGSDPYWDKGVTSVLKERQLWILDAFPNTFFEIRDDRTIKKD